MWALYDLATDPHETRNVARDNPTVLGIGLQKLDEWLGEQMPKAPRGDPLWGVIQEGGPLHANERSAQWSNYLRRLHETGRSHHAKRLEAQGGRPLTTGLE